MCSSMKQKLLVPEDFNGSKSLNNRLSKIACLTNIEDLDQNELLIKNSSRYSELNHQCSSYIKNMGVNQRKMEKCLIKAITPLQNINDKEELLLPPDFTINYQDTGTQKLKINFHDPTSCTNTSFDNSNDSYFKINIPSDKLVYKKKMSVSCHPAIEQARIITNADNKSKVPLLTPDCFLSTGNTNSNYEDTLSKCVINELNLDENLLEIHKNSSKNCTNLISAGENFCSKPCRRIGSFQNYFDNQNEMNRVLPTSMEGIKESLPERIYTAHAKRKLDFENEENFIGIKTENKLPPEFKCSLHLSENVPVSCGSYYEEKKSESPIPYKTKKELPSIGVFWDIENCRVPKGLCATHVVQEIRNRFFDGYREAEFVCVCDTLKENPKVLEELNDAQVNIMHVGSIVKNAADDKLLQGMRRFADLHGSEATIILISGDSDFATELYDLRYRKRLHVILIHNAHAQDSLKLSAHETVLFSEVIQEVPLKNIKPKSAQLCRDITVWNIPPYIDTQSVRKRLHFLASNCGGKGIFVKNGMAKISFQTPELAARAKKRIEGEDVYGSKVACTFGKDCTTSKFKSPGFHGNFQDYTPISKPQLPVRETDFLPESNFTHFESESKPPQRDCRDEQFGMDLNVGMWNKSSTISSASTMNMNGHSNYLNSTWGGMQSPTCQLLQEGGGGSYTSSPILHSSSQGSSRESSPHPFSFQKNNQDFPNRSSYRSSTNMQTKTGQHINDFRSLDDNRSPRMSQPWPSPYNKSNWPHSSQAQTDLQNQTLYSLGNLSMTETSRVSDNDSTTNSQSPVELQITNLDQHIDAREMKKILLAWFGERVMVLHVAVFVQSDGSLAATVTVPSQQDAQYAISQLHRKRIGTKRIIISYVTHSQQPPEFKRSKVLSLLKEVPGKKLPLFKFRELYERRFQETIGVSEMYNMRDTITVSDNSTGRMVCLNLEYRNIAMSSLANSSLQHPDDLRFCKIHSKGPDKSVGWAERDHSSILPNVFLTIKEVGHAIHILLQSHKGSIPLASLVDCYEAEVGPLVEDVEGAPLEHLVSCLTGVVIVTEEGGFKHIQRADPKVQEESEEFSNFISPPLVGHLALFSRELVDLLKTFPHCRMTFSRFIPAYHHHFGRQCRVADYGYTKLADLLVSLPHLIQIMGEGNKRIITLSHKAQVKRFSSDLLRVLKSQPSKVISLRAFPEAYQKVMNKTFNVTDYGICDIMDLLKEVQETTVILKNEECGTTIAIPKREQTAEEIERTRLFATEVVELLRHSPQCKMQFNRFIPAYHHHFGRQCRVSDYGFSKLIELFEAIPDVLQIFGGEDEGEKMLQLVEKEALRVLGDQIYVLVKNSPKGKIGLSALSTVFTHYYGYSLKPGDYNSCTFKELIEKLRNYVKLEEENEDMNVTLVDRSYINDLWVKSRKILWDVAKCSLPIKEFQQIFLSKYTLLPKMEVLKKDLDEFIQVTSEDETAEVKLVPLQAFARDLLILLYEAGGRMLLVNFETAYLNRFGIACRPATLGFPNLVALVQSLGSLATIKGRGTKRIIVLEKDLNLELPTYCPPQPRNVKPVNRESSIWSGNNLPANPVPPPPPPNCSTSNSSNPAPPPTPPCDHKFYHPDILNRHMMMGYTPPTPQPSYQPSSPVIYPGSPVAPNGSLVWGQMWSPQYSVMPPLSPAPHYMMPTIPINWGSIATSPILAPPPKPTRDEVKSNRRTVSPISIQTLDQLGKESPPNPSELPAPGIFSLNSVKHGLCSQDGNERLNATNNLTTSPSKTLKLINKRLAAHFDGTSTES